MDNSTTFNYEEARHNMVNQQIKAWGVTDPRVIQAIEETPREKFLPEEYSTLAYCDTEINIGHGRTVPSPSIIAKALNAVEITPNDDVLELATGSGYLTALLAQLSYHVTSIGLDKELTNKTQNALCDLRISNFHLLTTNIFDYIERYSHQFNVIITTCSLPQLPKEISKILKVDGRIFAVVGDAPNMHACIWRKTDKNELVMTRLFETKTQRLNILDKETNFTF